MNRVVLMGRLTKEPQITESGEHKIARYTLAVDRRTKEKQTDFISCVAFGRSADFAENYLHQGTKICVSGRIQTGSYTNREGKKVYTVDVVVDEQEFCESRSETHTEPKQGAVDTFTTNDRKDALQRSEHGLNGFIEVTDEQEELPFV